MNRIKYILLLFFFIAAGCTDPHVFNEALNKRFLSECERVGFKKGSNLSKLCIENKKDIYKVEQANSLRNLNQTNSGLLLPAGNSVSFSATFRLK
jgi:hypothetical protein